jgi:hypothetical protein
MVSGELLIRLSMLGWVTANSLDAQSRPMASGLEHLEKAIGIPINYEDPRFACPSEIHEVTDKVQNAAQRAANPNAHIFVPRGRVVPLSYVFPHATGPQDALSAANQLRLGYEAEELPGRFTLKYIGSVLTVQPYEARNSDCKWVPVTAAMETRITFPIQTMDATDAVTLVLSTLTARLGIKVGLAGLPMMAFVNRKVMLGALDEPANIVLVRLFELLSPTGRSRYSYHLLYDPGVKYYMLNIAATQNVRSD